MTPDAIPLDQWKTLLEKHGVFTFDVEHWLTDKKNPDPRGQYWRPEFDLWGVSFAIPNEDGTGDHVWFERDKQKYAEYLKVGIESGAESVAFNGKYDVKCIRAERELYDLDIPYEFPNLRDPMVGCNLLDDNRQLNQLSLEAIVKDLYGYSMDKIVEAAKGGPDSQRFIKYTCDDALYELRVWLRIRPKLQEQGLWSLFTRILMPVSGIFADLELEGIQWDTSHARKLIAKFAEIRDRLHHEIIEELGPLNLGSGVQLANRLFHELGYDTKGVPMTAGGKNTPPRFKVDAEVMDKLATKYPICNKIRVWRTCNKMIGTYLEPITRRALQDENARIHPSVWLTSATGRTRQDSPNFQNIPAYWSPEVKPYFEGTKIRDCVIARPGCRLVIADLSQIELRVCAHVTGDKEFLKAFRSYQCTNCGATGEHFPELYHECPHCGQAESEKILKDKSAIGFWHGLDLHQMTTDSVSALAGNRQAGKQANFALIYCATAGRMYHEHPELSRKQWQAIIDEFFQKYLGVKMWHLNMEGKLRKMSGGHAVVTDGFGRKRRIPEWQVRKMFKHCLNMACNFPVQAAACELLQLALVKMAEEFKSKGLWRNGVWFTNFVHDEVVFDVREDLIETAAEIICRHAENAAELRVPVRMEYDVADRWGDVKG